MTQFADDPGDQPPRRLHGRRDGRRHPLLRATRRGWCFMLGCVAGLALLLSPMPGGAAEGAGAVPWSEKDTRLAGEYLQLLVEKPEYGRVLDLLWELYHKHDATGFLLESMAAQAKTQPHPSLTLLHAHLLRKAGRGPEAATLYDEVLKQDPKNPLILRGRADLADETGDATTALAMVRRLLNLLPEKDAQRVPLLMEQGRLLLALNKSEEAAAAWEQATRLLPEDTNLVREVAQRLLGIGQLERALGLYQQLAQAADPGKRLDALQELARIEEQADHFDPAAAALQEGLDLLHFKDWRYSQFFLRLVRLHERFGHLDPLRARLEKAAAQRPVTEKALADMAKFAELTVDSEARLRFLRELVAAFPEAVDYRWQLVGVLLDHDQWQEAGRLVDEKLKHDGTDLPALVQLRSLAHLRAGEPEKAVAGLARVLDAQGGSAEVEQQVLAFARDKALDEIVERILRARLRRDPDKTEVAFELAAYLVKRQRVEDARKVLDEYAARPGLRPEEVRQRLQDVAAFLLTSQQAEAAEDAARRAVAAGGDRGALVQLADVLAQRGDHARALELLEQAWALSDSADRRTDVDEMMLSILSGDQVQETTPSTEPGGEFRMPSIFTGEGFGADAPAVAPKKGVPEAVVLHTAGLVLRLGDLRREAERALGVLPHRWSRALPAQAANLLPAPEAARPEFLQRIAWWSIRAEMFDMAYAVMARLHFDARGQWQTASVEVEKLLLDLARADQNVLLALRQLRLLATLEPESRFQHLMRLAEMEARRENQRGLDTAIRILEDLLREQPLNETLISMLAPLYLEDGRREDAATLWETAAAAARGPSSAPLLERYAEVLVSQGKFKEFTDVQMRLIENEPDVKRRREVFQRTMERLLWAGIVQGSLPDDQLQQRLKLLLTALEERARRAPFEGFWHEALAAVYERQGEAARAFEEMKQAYYTAPETPFSLEQLRAAAMRVGDIRGAIYFQKQIAAAASSRTGAEEWRELVDLLEQDFQMAEADRARRRLEARFSQDSAALEELARYYAETGQDDAARRVQEQVARVRSWDVKNLLRLALQQKHLGDTQAARATLRRLLATAPPPPARKGDATAVEKLPWPILDGRRGAAAAPTSLLSALDNVPGLEPQERERLRLFLAVPRAEFSEVPEDLAHIRLRAVEELASFPSGTVPSWQPGPGVALSDMEKAWALFHGGDGEGFRRLFAEKAGRGDSLELRFLRVWLGLKSHGVGPTIEWVRQKGLGEAAQKQRRGLFQAATHLLAEDETFVFTPADIEALGRASLLSNVELIDIARKLESQQRYELSLGLRLGALERDPTPQQVDVLFIAQLAEAMGRLDLQKQHLRMAWEMPVKAGPPQAFDPFLYATARLLRLSSTPEEREALLRHSWARLQALPASGQGTLRQALLLGLAGAEDEAVQRLSGYFSNGFLASQAFVEPMLGGRLPPGAPSPGPRIDEVNHMRHYWDDLREWGDLIRQEGLGRPFVEVERTLNQRLGGVPLGPKSNYEFGVWRSLSLVRQLRYATYPERVRLLREFLEADEEVETLLELGRFLEGQGFSRECLEIYRRLPDRAPSNAEYCEQYLRMAETAWECAVAIPFIEKLFVAEPNMKPQNLAEALLEEKHARFLARLQDVPRLRGLAYRGSASVKPMLGRVPDEVPYLRELALLLERRGDKPGALASWEQLHSFWPQDTDAVLRASRLLAEQGNKNRALELLRKVDYTNLWNEPIRDSLVLRVRLAAETGQWDEVRLMMNVVTGTGGKGSLPQTDSVVAVGRELVAHDRRAEAQNLLVRAERAAKDGMDRFRLRLAQLQLMTENPAWNPQQDGGRIRSLFLVEQPDPEALAKFTDLMMQEASGPRAKAWVQVLQETPARGLTPALAWAAFAPHLTGAEVPSRLVHPWAQAGSKVAPLQRLAVQTLLKQRRPTWARAVATAGEGRGLANTPVMVDVLAAQQDAHGLNELFAQVVRMNFPGGGEAQAFAEAFDKNGRADLAAELYDLAVDRLRATGNILPKLVESYARFLIARHQYEKAESLLLVEHQGMTEGLPSLLLDLYRGWNKLDRLPQELAKFHLPDGLLSEVMFLHQQNQPPPPSPSS